MKINVYTVGNYRFSRIPEDPMRWKAWDKKTNEKLGEFEIGWRARQYCRMLMGLGTRVPCS